MRIEGLYGQIQASADASTQWPVQTGSPEMLMATDPFSSEEQNACPNALIMHIPGPHSIWPSAVLTIPP